MRRLVPHAVPVAAVLLVVAGLAPGCSSDTASPPGTTVNAAVTADPSAAFLAATAAHVCEVQSNVYDSPEALAAAYQAPPDYKGLSAEQVAQYQSQLANDPAYSDRLTALLSDTCHPGSTPPATSPP